MMHCKRISYVIHHNQVTSVGWNVGCSIDFCGWENSVGHVIHYKMGGDLWLAGRGCTVDQYLATYRQEIYKSKFKMFIEMKRASWQPLLELLSWYPVMQSSVCNSFEYQAVVAHAKFRNDMIIIFHVRNIYLKDSDNELLTHCDLTMPYDIKRFWLKLVQIMACCLTAPSHYFNQCWLMISIRSYGIHLRALL